LSFLEAVHPDDQAREVEVFKQQAAGFPTDTEYRLVHPDGSIRWVWDRGYPARNESGEVYMVTGMAQDITERKLAGEKLRESEEQFRMIAENVADLIVVLDTAGNRLYNSPSYTNILGEPDLLKGTPSFDEVHPEDRERIKSLFFDTVRTGIGHRAEFRFINKDGAIRDIESNGSAIRDENGNVSRVLVVSRDITEKKKLEAQFLRAQRMESVGALAGGIAHDLNNVLAPILMAVEILKKKHPDNDTQRILNTLESSAQRGSGMIRQVLTFARGIEGERAPVQVGHLIREMEKIIRETFPKSIQLKTQLPKNLWIVSADVTQLHQVLLNLCVNARDAMPGGGMLTLSAENVMVDENYARMQSQAKVGPHIAITITDAGTGIPPHVIDKIFDPFFTTKEVGKGTGLGLSTVHSIVKSHGGFINVYSEMGKGTKFHIYIPAEPAGVNLQVELEQVGLPTGNGELILVVDDEASIRDICQVTLETYGYSVLTAADGTEAVVQYSRKMNEIRLVITDMMMPFMDGRATIRALTKMNPKVRIIASSGLSAEEKSIDRRDLTMYAFLPKPYTAGTLLTTVSEVLAATLG
jgi:PAS domain S-box-containing protein